MGEFERSGRREPPGRRLEPAPGELGARAGGDRLRSGAREQQVVALPIGIDPSAFEPGPAAEARRPLRPLVRGRRLVLGVDWLDYAKGIPESRRVSLVQVAAPSRTRVASYVDAGSTPWSDA
jgi:trehalose-6-phosphate synthase